jgi:HlyD family secretion protein
VVSKGDVVVKLDDRNLAAALASAEARRDGEMFRLQSEQSRLTGVLSAQSFAKKELERKQSLYDSGDLSRQDLDNAQQRVDDMQAQVDSSKHSISVIESSMAAAKADIDQSKQMLAKTVILSPMDGLITALNAEVGEVVMVGTMNNPGTVIMTIADLSRMILKAEVSETDIAKILVGQPCKVHINAYRDQVFSGSVTQIALQRTNNLDGTGYFETEVEIDLRGSRILSGLIANVDIEIANHDGLAVESQAVVDRSVEDLPESIKRENALVDMAKKTTTVVYRAVNGKAVCTPVKRGANDDTHSVVLAGLSESDKVIVGPYKVLEKLKHDELVMDETADKKANGRPEPSESKEAEEAAVTVSVGS